MRRLALFLLLLICALSVPISADDGLPDLSEPLEDFVDALPDDLLDELPPGLLAGEPDGEALRETLTAQNLLERLQEIFRALWPDAGARLGQLVGGILLAAVARTVLPGEGRLAEGARFCARLCISCVVIEGIVPLLGFVRDCLTTLGTVTGAIVPLLCAILASGGRAGTASAAGGGLSVFLALGELLCGQVFLPLAAAVCALSAMRAFPGSGRLAGVISGLKKTLSWMLGPFGAIFAAVMATQTALAAGADSVAARTVKFAVGTAVPVIGSAVGDTVRTVGAALGYLRSVVGVAGLWVLALIVLPPLCALFVHRAVLLVASTVAELLGCGDEARLCGEAAGAVGTLLAILALAMACLVFALVLLTRVALAGQ